MSWNYRLVHKAWPDDDPPYEQWAIHEVYYDEDDNPTMVTVDPVAFLVEDLGEVQTVFDWYRKALSKPVLEYDEIGNDD